MFRTILTTFTICIASVSLFAHADDFREQKKLDLFFSDRPTSDAFNSKADVISPLEFRGKIVLNYGLSATDVQIQNKINLATSKIAIPFFMNKNGKLVSLQSFEIYDEHEVSLSAGRVFSKNFSSGASLYSQRIEVSLTFTQDGSALPQMKVKIDSSISTYKLVYIAGLTQAENQLLRLLQERSGKHAPGFSKEKRNDQQEIVTFILNLRSSVTAQQVRMLADMIDSEIAEDPTTSRFLKLAIPKIEQLNLEKLFLISKNVGPKFFEKHISVLKTLTKEDVKFYLKLSDKDENFSPWALYALMNRLGSQSVSDLADVFNSISSTKERARLLLDYQTSPFGIKFRFQYIVDLMKGIAVDEPGSKSNWGELLIGSALDLFLRDRLLDPNIKTFLDLTSSISFSSSFESILAVQLSRSLITKPDATDVAAFLSRFSMVGVVPRISMLSPILDKGITGLTVELAQKILLAEVPAVYDYSVDAKNIKKLVETLVANISDFSETNFLQFVDTVEQVSPEDFKLECKSFALDRASKRLPPPAPPQEETRLPSQD